MKKKAKSIFKKLLKRIKHLDTYQLLTIPVLLVLILCTVDFKTNSLNIGVVLPLSDNSSKRAQSHLNGIKLAINHINKQGGINSIPLKLIVKDSDKQDAAEETRDLIYINNVKAILGGFTSKETRTIQKLSEKAQIPFLTGICTHYEISKSAPYTFRTITDDQHQFEALSLHSLTRFKSKRPAIIYDSELYGLESAQRYEETCSKNSQSVTIKQTYPTGTINFKTQLEEIQRSKPDCLVILANAADSALIVRQAREMGFEKPILGGNQCASNEFLQLSGLYSEGITATLPFNPISGGQRSDEFLNAYQETYEQQADADAATGYEMTMILSTALTSSEATGNNLRESLSALHGWDNIIGSGGFDNEGNQVRPSEIAIIKDKQTIPISMEELF